MNLAPTICEDCEKVFQGGPYSYFCPDCRKKRLRAAAKKRNLNKLGNDAYSEQRAIARAEAGTDVRRQNGRINR